MSDIYPTSIEEALPSDDKVAEARERLEAAGVKYVLSCWIDMHGLPKTKPVPLSQWETICRGKGPQFAVHSISFVPELGPADPDQVPIPDVDALYLCPWDREIAFVFADLYMPSGPYALCPRLALKRQVEAAATAGYRFFAGVEPEFMVIALRRGRRAAEGLRRRPRSRPGHAPAAPGLRLRRGVLARLHAPTWEP